MRLSAVRPPCLGRLFPWVFVALAACAHSPPPVQPSTEIGNDFRPVSAHPVLIAEPAANEAVIVINHNAPRGNHAGMFLGTRLSDSAGNYLAYRRNDPEWRGTTLADYLSYQMADGVRIRLYRFRLTDAEVLAIGQRIDQAGPGAPLYCAADVQNQIAGIGPFAGIGSVHWTSPASLAERLDALVKNADARGLCQWPDGQPCTNKPYASGLTHN